MAESAIHGDGASTAEVLAQRWFVDTETLRRWGRFRVFENVVGDLCRVPAGVVPTFISHRWLSSSDPDPNREQHALVMSIPRRGDFFWYDYSCMPQSAAKHDIQAVLDTLHTQIMASQFVVLRTVDDDYFFRGWCFHEWFTAQFLGCEERDFLAWNDQPDDRFSEQIVNAKQVADRLIAGDFEPLDRLKFLLDEDRVKVTCATRKAVMLLQGAIVERLLLRLFSHLDPPVSPQAFKAIVGLARKRFERVAAFVKCWARFLQPVEPVSSRIAVFLSPRHTDSFLDLTTPAVAGSLMDFILRKRLKFNLSSEAEVELQKCFEQCERRFPTPVHLVVALLCQTLVR